MALTKIDDRGLKTPIDLLDSEKIRFGTGNDLEIYHDGSNGNYIKSAVDDRDLFLQSTRDVYITTGDGSTGIHTFLYAADNAGVELRYDNAKKFETDTNGVTITGQCAVTANIALPDHSSGYVGKMVFGGGDDLQIFHDGSNSYLRDATAGHLRIENDNIRLRNGASNETMLAGTVNDSVQLYFDNSLKLATTSSGATVIGELQIGDTSNHTKELRFADSTRVDASSIKVDNSNANLLITNDRGSGEIRLATNSAERLRIDSSGKLLLGTTRTQYTNEYYDDITINNSGGSGNTGACGITMLSDSMSWGAVQFGDDDDDDVGYMKYAHNGDFLRFGTAGNTRFRIDADGVKFNGDTAASNALDDYEEGSFTPTWGTAGSALSGITYSYQYGFYTKIGNLVHVMIWINTTGNNDTSSTDVLQLNLPFASKNHTGYRGGMGYSFNGINVHDDFDDSDDQVTRTHLNKNVAWMEVGFGSNLNGGNWDSGAIRRGGIIDGSSGIQLEGTYLTS